MMLTLEVQAVAEPEVQVAAPPDVGVIHRGTRKVFEAGGGTIGGSFGHHLGCVISGRWQ